MDLPVLPPVRPMLAKAVTGLPEGDGLVYEPKWDGFRAIVFRHGDTVEIGSRNTKPLTRYFPEVVAAVLAELPDRCVLDGEIVIPTGDRLDFEALLQRIHPADSRVQKLSVETPAHFVAFDVLALGDEDLTGTPFGERRARLEQALSGARPPVHLTPATTDPAVAREWFTAFEGAGLDGLIVKDPSTVYAQNERTMRKVKHARTADCVLAGFRWHKTSTADAPLLGSLMLGLYDDRGVLQSVGVAASFTAARRAELIEELAPLRADSLVGHPWQEWAAVDGVTEDRLPGATSRWNAGKDLSWVPLRPERVVQVRYDAMEGTRFRHTAQFDHWRPDREPQSCTYDQLDRPVRYDLANVLAGKGA